ncbi:biotin--[acetyl-CoA-carboxylase] ligase [Helicobacter sp. MIT 99-5507]|uniref:biotin--[acetyl-CoA-carboxylase] ligase n=1 Tax=Helicobacter sp. MIT 99-5507 TaxID=152489 RepID=UPI000E1E52F6|nr:biotin--[acetyl-CoA-carboxylase] ligase [Helicobacter sp. MIT 99-5507]RDU58396.1 biotin--[acetyl-CoA-carboxylase] ligase [Helicobacter sp. MIT 99-5507]
MEIKIFDTLPSTQKYLINEIKNHNINDEICIIAINQNQGIGSRENSWNGVDKGLYFSFAKKLSNLPRDLRLESMSIFFGFIFKEILAINGSKAWLKYPNDLYIDENKIGGILCNLTDGFVICGIGLNLESNIFTCIENNVINDINKFLESYFDNIKAYTWDLVFNKYQLEFYKNHNFSFHHKNKIISFRDAKLLNDGAIEVDGTILYSCR